MKLSLSSLVLLCAVTLRGEAPISPTLTPLAIAEVKREKSVDFEREVLPIFKGSCLACHNQTKAKASLVLETPQTISKGGDSGAVVVPGKGAESLLLKAAAHQIEDMIMPPKNNKVAANDLTPDQLGIVRLWIDQGATGEVRSAGPIEWRPVPANLQPIYAVALSPDRQFVACGRANRIAIYHLPSRGLIAHLTDPDLSRDADHSLAAAGPAQRDLVHALEFSPDGSVLASGGYREVKLWRQRGVPPPVTVLAGGAAPGGSTTPDGKISARLKFVLHDTVSGKELGNVDGLPGSSPTLVSSPDGQLLAAVVEDALIIWDVTRGKPLPHADGVGEVHSVVWLPKPRQLATGGADGVIRIWDVGETTNTSFKIVKEIKGHSNAVTSLALTPAPVRLVSGGKDGWMRITPLDKDDPVRALNHEVPVMAVAVSPDGKRFASVGGSNVKLWGDNNKMLALLKGDPQLDRMTALRTNAHTLAVAEVTYQKGILKAAEEAFKKEEERFKKATEASGTAKKALAEKEKALAEATAAKTAADEALAKLESDVKMAAATLAKAETTEKEAQAAAREAQAQTNLDAATVAERQAEAEVAVEAVADAKVVNEKAITEQKAKEGGLKDKVKSTTKALADADKDLKKAQQNHTNAETELSLAVRGLEQLAQATVAGTNGVATAENGRKEAEAALETARKLAANAEKPFRAATFSADNLWLVTAGDDGFVRTWSAENGHPGAAFPASVPPGSHLTFQTNGLFLTGASKMVRYDLTTRWDLERTLGGGDLSSPIADRVNALAISPDGNLLATGGGEPSRSGEILLWELPSGKFSKALKDVHSDTVLDLEFSPDGKFLGSSGADRFLRVTMLGSGQVVKSFEGHTHHVLGLGWKADGRTVVTAGADNVVKVWDIVSGERKKNIEGFSKEVTSVRFVGVTDQFLASAGDGKVRLLRENGNEVRSYSGAADFVYASAVSADGKVVVAGGADGILKVWNADDGKVIATFEPPK